ncbi:MAG: type II toxin-antitoxin system VapC family toxin [Bacteroidetes bacterium]|nr:type II toxin-antitoxin system VapC family toxin [Bacteroidota bacterium]
MRPLRVYIDTSVIGGYFDQEFEKETKLLFEKFQRKEYQLVISDLTERELVNAPDHVRTLLKDLAIKDIEEILVTDEIIQLATEYIDENVVGQTSFDDCIHIATATLNRVDLLASWNFRHIVNIRRIRGYNSINLKNGYPILEIRSPKDIIDYER